MKQLTKLSAISALTLALSAAVWAAPDAARPEGAGPDSLKLRQPVPMAQFPHAGPGFPPPIPLYEASIQTRNPSEALNKLVANAPKGADKNYEVRVMVRELPADPAIAPEQAANK
ncbi:hypothetical protein VSX61_08550 [Brenneria populi subsp. brevivirga]|uniref:hypothetical protein n=1 Tax=Brenneria populi TaxID=1505588 RepID=UPI002E1750BF|nr:hypothetical protein [Brenneria populi subsp. brevivirga]